mmetsp:Transcript_3008/g.5927  ORF Transcript_3008/g.5927 Transcript_3008/m.5927 type:complete len:221 (-) Transcript_3008:134-796(-)
MMTGLDGTEDHKAVVGSLRQLQHWSDPQHQILIRDLTHCHPRPCRRRGPHVIGGHSHHQVVSRRCHPRVQHAHSSAWHYAAAPGACLLHSDVPNRSLIVEHPEFKPQVFDSLILPPHCRYQERGGVRVSNRRSDGNDTPRCPPVDSGCTGRWNDPARQRSQRQATATALRLQGCLHAHQQGLQLRLRAKHQHRSQQQPLRGSGPGEGGRQHPLSRHRRPC